MKSPRKRWPGILWPGRSGSAGTRWSSNYLLHIFLEALMAALAEAVVGVLTWAFKKLWKRRKNGKAKQDEGGGGGT